MYQKCPICNGTGIPTTWIQISNSVCPTCQGKKIISKLTGLPPVSVINTEQVITSKSKSYPLTPTFTNCENDSDSKLEYKKLEWVCQFNNDEPVVLIQAKELGVKQFTMVLDNTSTSKIIFSDGKGNEFKIFAREQN